MYRYLTVIDKNNVVVLSFRCILVSEEKIAVDSDYSVVFSDEEPIFTPTFGKEGVKYYPENQKKGEK